METSSDKNRETKDMKKARILKVCSNSTIIKFKNCVGYPFIHPLFSVRFDRKLLKFLRQIVSEEDYDWLYLDHSQMFLYGKYFPEMNDTAHTQQLQ